MHRFSYSPLLKSRTIPRRRLVFTSASSQGNVDFWKTKYQSFDIWVTDYTNEDAYPFFDVADYFNCRAGGKFPNYHYIHHVWPDILENYQSVMLLDDDIFIDGDQINKLFDLLDQHDLWLIQPTFHHSSRLSHAVNARQCTNNIRLTNFVEVNAPLFRKTILDSFMKVYDPKLVGFGVDYWYHDFLGEKQSGRIGLVDGIDCINPFETEKQGKLRSIDILQSKAQRIHQFEQIKRKFGITMDSVISRYRRSEGYAQHGVIKI